MARRRSTTRAEDRAFLAQVFEDATRDWQPGDPCASFHPGRTNSTVLRREGDRIYLADDSAGHVSRMRRAR